MKKISLLLPTSVVMLVASLFSVQPIKSAPPKAQYVTPQSALFLDYDTRLDCNNLDMFVYNDGNFAYDNANVLGKTDGLYYPRGTTKTVIYSAGIWIGAKVNGQIRLAMAEYGSEFAHGPMVNGSFQSDHDRFRVYKVNRGDNAFNNPDYASWPVDQGAPIDEHGSPLILGDQITWSAFNDADPVCHTNNAGSTLPLGVEIQHSTFGYTRSGPLGNVYFLKFKIINKGGNNLQDAYVSIWADPDLGDPSDDLVGCDTILGLGYCYNEGADATYGANPPVVGFDFLQGPIVPGLPTDTAFVSGEARPGFRNLKMVSFNKYINGTDPTVSWETYGYMCGLVKDPYTGQMVPMINPTNNQVTNYAVSGNPVNQTGWIDEASADRRLMLSSGPFNMAPGDTQEVVAAVLVGQGNNSTNSITVLQQTDSEVQAAYDGNFDIPNPNKTIEVNSRGRDRAVDLFWTSEMVGDVIYYPTFGEVYEFEGFNVFQAQTPYGPWKKLATYDVNNDVALIYGDVLNPDIGAIERVVVQNGNNSGLQFHQFITADAFTHQPLQNGETYYFGVSGYYYDVNHMTEFNDQFGNFLGYLAPTLESQKFIINAIPVSDPGILSDTAVHIAGQSDGRVIIEWIDPAARTGHDYRINFNSDLSWNLQDATLGTVLLNHQENQSGDFNYLIVDGFMSRVIGSQPGVKKIEEVANAYGPVFPPDNVHMSRNSTSEWYMDPLGDHSMTRYRWTNPSADDYEIRIVGGATESCFDWFGPYGNMDYGFVNAFKVPVELWNIGSGTPEGTFDDVRVAFMLLDDGQEFGEFDWGDGIYIHEIPYDDVNWADPNDNAGNYDPDLLLRTYRRFRFFPQNPDNIAGSYPAEGTVVRITTSRPNTIADIFEFSTGFDCGDVNQSGEVDITDAIALINYLFAITLEPVDPLDADVNCDGRVRITDCVFLINYIFLGGPEPCAACP